jgi:hypothetical protein
MNVALELGDQRCSDAFMFGPKKVKDLLKVTLDNEIPSKSAFQTS